MSVCGPCHIKAERNLITPLDFQKILAIIDVPYPPGVDKTCDKWGEPMKYIKYPRTAHLPWSPGATDDDIRKSGFPELAGREVIVQEKMDGENTSMYNDHIHARSIDSPYHESRTWVGNLHGAIKHDIPEGYRICGENLQAVHSIEYFDLHSYFQVFSIWNRFECLSWDDTVDWCELLGLTTVPVLWRGNFDEFEKIHNMFDRLLQGESHEGYVVRLADKFHYDDFTKYVGKFVRPHHVQPESRHWRSGKMTENGLKS